MAVMNLFKTTTAADSPLDASGGTDPKSAVSDFLTVQALANFAAMTGAISAAWHALQRIIPSSSALWVPLVFAVAWGIVSILISFEGLKKGSKREPGTIAGAVFVALINSLVLAGAVIGTDVATSQTPPA